MIEVAATRLPPTFWTMSANTVVVVTTLMAPGPGVATEPVVALGELPDPWHAARAIAATATIVTRCVMRLSLIYWRILFLRAQFVRLNAWIRRRRWSSPGSGGRARTIRACGCRSGSHS